MSVIGLAVPLVMMEQLVRDATTTLAPDIQRTFQLDDAMLIAVLAFGGVALTLFGPLAAWIADRVRRRWVIVVSASLGTLAMVGAFFATEVWQIFVALTVAGLAGAYSNPVFGTMIAEAYPIEGRGRVYSFHAMATPLGQLLGPTLAGSIAALSGAGENAWRYAYLGLAVPYAILVILTIVVLKEPPRGGRAYAAATQGAMAWEKPIGVFAAFKRLVKIRAFLFLCLGIGSLGLALYAVPIQFSLLLGDTYQLDALQRGLIFSPHAGAGHHRDDHRRPPVRPAVHHQPGADNAPGDHRHRRLRSADRVRYLGRAAVGAAHRLRARHDVQRTDPRLGECDHRVGHPAAVRRAVVRSDDAVHLPHGRIRRRRSSRASSPAASAPGSPLPSRSDLRPLAAGFFYWRGSRHITADSRRVAGVAAELDKEASPSEHRSFRLDGKVVIVTGRQLRHRRRHCTRRRGSGCLGRAGGPLAGAARRRGGGDRRERPSRSPPTSPPTMLRPRWWTPRSPSSDGSTCSCTRPGCTGWRRSPTRPTPSWMSTGT